MINKEE